jgi:Peptidase_C39 like family
MWKTRNVLPALIGLTVVLGQSPDADAATTWEEAEQEAGAYSDAPTELPANDTIIASSAGSWVTSFISGQLQQRSNWCGPAAAATTLTNWQIPGVSQSTLASEMHTDSLGFTPPWNIDDSLNFHVNHYFGQPNQILYKTFRDIDNNELWNYAKPRIHDFGDVLIVLVYSRKIWYPSAPAAEAHYLVIYGYNDNWDGHGPAYLVWDPAGGTHHLSKDDWSRVAYPGFFVVAPTY